MKPLNRLPEFNFRNPSTELITIHLTEVTVQQRERALRVTWTPELAQDLNAYHHIDAELELTRLLSEQVAAEIDNNILQTLLNNQERYTIEEPIVFDIKPTNKLKKHFLVEPPPELPPAFDLPLLPIARRVATQTIGMDLVPVQPMGNPTGGLFYFQPQVVGEPTVFDDGAWHLDNTFESVFISSQIKRHEFTS